MVTVGVTGGIGSGKSTVCEIWSQMGAYILNADDLAKELMVSKPEIRDELVQTFGAEAFADDGSLNRKYLAKEAFERDRVDELNAIVHPQIPGAAQEKMAIAEQEGYEVFVYEAALLLENLEPGALDFIVLVLADEQQRLERVQERDESSAEDIRQRMAKQRNFEESTDKADIIIRNNGTLKELKKKAEIVYEKFLPLSGKNENNSHK
ncbi:dephospho-CoA kinase [Fodinibius halophilus]|uniref:Dephospho-CoA kinase n=1 Tax=Fodinibius halophilus TaxID=1736908 RepID=A0A6M1TK10_9BACT|nr:dephospho-CoA kinase [Fodinibius halophilus]NGP88920.1 dephospho-CoA kinase [Fodinibius halophilus]